MPSIIVNSFDFDGCLFNQFYIKSQNVITANHKLFGLLNNEAKEQNPDKIIYMVGSNRQSVAMDEHNSKINHTTSCFSALQNIVAEMAKILPFTCELDRYLLADTHDNLPDGESFNRALDPNQKTHATQWFDKNKILLLYAQMHRTAATYPNHQIQFRFYDDRRFILDKLEEIFSLYYPELVPQNVKIHLHFYNGETLLKKTLNDSSGPIDYDWKKNIALLAQFICHPPRPQEKYLDHHEVALFKKQRNLSPFVPPPSVLLSSRPSACNFFTPSPSSSISTAQPVDIDPFEAERKTLLEIEQKLQHLKIINKKDFALAIRRATHELSIKQANSMVSQPLRKNE